MKSFSAINLNNPVYGQHSIMEITRYIYFKSVVCILSLVYRRAVRSLRFTSGPLSAFYTDGSTDLQGLFLSKRSDLVPSDREFLDSNQKDRGLWEAEFTLNSRSDVPS